MFKELAFVLAAAAAITNTTAAVGDEDIPRGRAQRAAPPAIAPPPFYNWAGPYVGVAGGFAWGRSNQRDPGFFIPTGGGGPPPEIIGGLGDGSFSLNGGLIGGGGGYNFQFGQWVVGLETDYSWADISGSSNGCGAAFISHTCSTQGDSLGTFRGRIGYAVGAQGTWLLYGTGGLAYGNLKGADSFLSVSGSELRAGWQVGAGGGRAPTRH